MARKRSRWGDAQDTADGGENGGNGDTDEPTTKKRKSRFSSAAPPDTTTDSAAASAGGDDAGMGAKKAKAAALQASIAQRLAALKAKKAGGAAAAAPPAAPAAAAPAVPAAAPAAASKKARTYEIDMSDTTPLFKKEQRKKAAAAAQPKKKANPYLAHLEPSAAEDSKTKGSKKADGSAGSGGAAGLSKGQTDAAPKVDDEDSNAAELLLDGRLRGGKVAKARSRHRPLTFVQPGKYTALAEQKRQRLQNAAAAGYASGRKAGYVPATMATAGGAGAGAYGSGEAGLAQELTLANLPARADAPDPADEAARRDNAIPAVMEWWDVELIPRGRMRTELADIEAKHRREEALGGIMLVPSRNKAATNEGEAKENGDGKEEDAKMVGTADANADRRLQLEERCYQSASSTNARTHGLVQHPVPIKPPNAATGPPVQPTLHLTKREMKRQRKMRRAEKQREIQDMQAAGLVPPPEPRLTLSNFMRVLGDQAVMDPSQMEQKVMEQIQGRKIRHEKMNAERKLTKEQRKEKRARKLAEDTTGGVSVALFLVKDLSHRYHRTKVDLNAQQNDITGGVLEVDHPQLALVIAEGGPKAIKRYNRLMTVRMKWRGENFLGDDGEEESDNEEAMQQDGGGAGGEDGEEGEKEAHQKFNRNNTCELIWTGMGAKRMFTSFVFQKCETADVARKVLEAKGVAHFMDQVLIHASGRGSEFNFKLGGGNGDTGGGGDNGMDES